MISLPLLDSYGFWTDLGLAIKLGSIFFIIAIGIALFIYTNPVFYFTTWWLFLVFTPQIILLGVENRDHNICMEILRVIPCNESWGLIWLTIAMFEIVFIWVPAVGFVARNIRKRRKQEQA